MRVALRYHEIALKGKNRPFFVATLVRNLETVLADLGVVRVRSVAGRVEVEMPAGAPWDEVRARIARVFGVANFSRVHESPRDLETLAPRVLAALAAAPPASFRVTARRADKSFPLISGQIERALGGMLHQAAGWPVRLEDPAVTVWVEVLADRFLYSFERLPGAGGFAVGSSGKVLALLSGGIDSPVAAWRMMRRGCRVTLAHFHAFPLQDHTTIDKARELARVLARWQLRSKLLLVPFAPVQQTIVAACPAPLRVVLYRRFMVRIGERLAGRVGARALVTGESLGQVASQTLDNMVVIDEAARGPVLRPLVGMDKDEITQQARVVGSFEVSTLPDQDCCQLFVPRSPATAAHLDEVRRAEEALDVPALVDAAVRGTEEERFAFPAATPEATPA